MTIGKWSVFTGLDASSVSHLTSASMRDSVQKTLSTLVRFPVFCARRVGIAGGRAIFMLCRPSIFKSGCARSRFLLVNRWAFLCSSHIGWWRLKSPNQIVWIGAGQPMCCPRSRMKLDRCVRAVLLLQLLYMLMIHMVPKGPFSSIAVMSGCWKFSCFHESVRRLVFIRSSDQIGRASCRERVCMLV